MIALLASACTKVSNKREMAVTTDDVVISNTQIMAKGTLVDLGENEIRSYGFCWSPVTMPTVSDNLLAFTNAAQTGEFNGAIINVFAGNSYFVRSFIDDGEKVVYGEELTFTPISDGLQLVTDTVLLLSSSSVSVTGHIQNVGSLMFQDFGLCWAEETTPSAPVHTISLGNLDHDTVLSHTLLGLSTGTPYYARIFVRLNDDFSVIYGNILQFTIPDLVVSTDTFAINGTTASLYGTIVSLGIPAVTEHGFCWSYTTSNPNINNNKIEIGAAAQTGTFTSNLPGLISGTTYYFRAYATDGSYIKYGQIIQFTP
jgi:hypothetical protein